jgi:glycosyltransferase involved in cell wall biosynthesis
VDLVPQCTVVIPTYNRAELLRHTLDSLAGQDLVRDRFEVLVVDDGSSDSTAQVVDGFRDRLDVRYFFQPDEGWRVAQARNVGIAHAAGEICVFVDSGVVLHSGCLRAHLRSHAESARPLAVCGYVYGFFFDVAQIELMKRTLDLDDPDASIALMQRTGQWGDIRDELFYAKHGDDFSHLPAPWVMYWTCNASARTAQLRSVGAFDEAFRSWGGEDIDLGFRLRLDGAGFVLNRSASAIHYPHPKTFDEPGAQAAANVNYRYIARKYGTPITRLVRFFDRKINPFNLNDLAAEFGLPDCLDVLAQREAASGTGG